MTQDTDLETQARANAAYSAAGQFSPDCIQAQAAQLVAGRLEDIAETVRHLDVQETINEVSSFARRNPVAFLGATALAGFAATRFLKTTTPQTTSDDADGDVLTQTRSEARYAAS
ncbi:hypothetical protein [Phaeobacter sp. HF9A]|uniref:hypothetical protein n=1 Tax=Phaeobacter sp. HF9A TaxID=2721561 RepID=UPI001431D893|nr:hypothetical protein [Phaeobacter sp. HF9A]NIZ12086.1 hypothetical protein [Phaeobacter sp. HF9A]